MPTPVTSGRSTEKQKTMLDCAKEDGESFAQIQKGLDTLIGHEMIGTTSTGYYYRGHIFDITLKEKQAITKQF